MKLQNSPPNSAELATPTEIELKLRLPPELVGTLLAQPILSARTPQKYRLLNTYYDTPELDLLDLGVALRLRQKGASLWLMTVKKAISCEAGLAQRREWEVPTQPGIFDFSVVSDADLRTLLVVYLPSLRPIFSTDFERTAWTLAHQGSIIELALDQGEIRAPLNGTNERREALCEVELELLEGASPAALFDLARQLAVNVPSLQPENCSKAERGYTLAAGA